MGVVGDLARWLADPAHWRGPAGVPARTLEHLALSATALLVALAVAVPLGLLLGHTGRGGALAINVSNVGRAIPSFALLVLAVQVFGLGDGPPFVALVALALPPVLTNTYVGVRSIDRDVLDSARGMGMTAGQVLRRVETPLALPLIMAGIRTASVQVIATAALAAVVASGGLGRYIVDGFAQQDDAQLLAGALLVALLAVLVEVVLGRLQARATPGRRAGRRSAGDDLTLPGAVATATAPGS
jgi:osmoprotectant transport system permease protein